MSSRSNRASSPASAAEQRKVEETKEEVKKAVVKWEPPPRPAGLRESILHLYSALGLVLLFFALVALSFKHPVPEGKFEKKDGTLIDISDFDPVELGPYPKCHPGWKHYANGTNESGGIIWVLNDAAPSDGPFPPGHPENEAWKEKSDKEMKQENAENRFTWKGLQPCFHLLLLAYLAVTIGCKHGTWIFTCKEDSEEASKDSGAAMLQKDDAYLFPVWGSVALFSLFIVYKYLGSDWIKYAFSCYVVFMCVGGFGMNVGQLVTLVRGKSMKPLFKVPYLDVGVSTVELLGFAAGLAMGVIYLLTKNWFINNCFGLSFCLLGIKKIGIPTVKIGAIMLVGLFFYDVFWVFGSKSVFGSNVMVTVAKGVEAPIKLMFPRSQDGCGNLEFSMLGLGDIVVPGMYIAFLAKYDAVVQGLKKADSFVYLNATMVAYVLSLMVTLGSMLFFNAAQPALLYIVPLVIIASLGLAFSRGEFKAMMEYEIPEEEEKPAVPVVDKKTD